MKWKICWPWRHAPKKDYQKPLSETSWFQKAEQTVNEQEKKMRHPKIEYWEARDKNGNLIGKWYFHLKSSNGNILVTSQGYSSERACLRGVKAHKDAMAYSAMGILEMDIIKIER